jgi:hypothetical protein
MKCRGVKRITYVGTSVLVSDEFGDVMLEYAAALARSNTSETLTFRGVDETDHQALDISFIVGPASEIVIEGVPDAAVEQTDNAAVIEFMNARRARLRDEQAGERAERVAADRAAAGPVVRPEPANNASPLVDGLDF